MIKLTGTRYDHRTTLVTIGDTVEGYYQGLVSQYFKGEVVGFWGANGFNYAVVKLEVAPEGCRYVVGDAKHGELSACLAEPGMDLCLVSRPAKMPELKHDEYGTYKA